MDPLTKLNSPHRRPAVLPCPRSCGWLFGIADLWKFYVKFKEALNAASNRSAAVFLHGSEICLLLLSSLWPKFVSAIVPRKHPSLLASWNLARKSRAVQTQKRRKGFRDITPTAGQ